MSDSELDLEEAQNGISPLATKTQYSSKPMKPSSTLDSLNFYGSHTSEDHFSKTLVLCSYMRSLILLYHLHIVLLFKKPIPYKHT